MVAIDGQRDRQAFLSHKAGRPKTKAAASNVDAPLTE